MKGIKINRREQLMHLCALFDAYTDPHVIILFTHLHIVSVLSMTNLICKYFSFVLNPHVCDTQVWHHTVVAAVEFLPYVCGDDFKS